MKQSNVRKNGGDKANYKSQPRRRGRNKEIPFAGVKILSSATTPSSDWKIPSFHAPLIQWTEEASTWYDYGENLPGRNDVIGSSSASSSIHEHRLATKLTTPALISRYRSMADSIFQNELRLYNSSQNKKSSSDERWVENTMKKGTLKDRIAAMSVTVSTDPLHKFHALDGLMGMVGCAASSFDGNHGGGGKPNSRVAQLTAEALEDLFVNTLLPKDRKLVTLAQRPLYRYEQFSDDDNKRGDDDNLKKKKGNATKTLSPRILLLWRFEELIKEKYDLYLRQYMAQTLLDGAEQQKTKILQSAANLLSSLPEGESKLLSMMVNKLGDPDKKTAAAAGHQLRVVLQRHPAMQDVVAREAQQLAHRPHLSPKALYNCIVFLNQLHLKRTVGNSFDDGVQHPSTSPSLAASLIKTYFRLFEVAVQKNQSKHGNKGSSSSSTLDEAGTMKSRLLSALLTGVNRAHPYLPEKDKDMQEHIDALYRIVHTAPPAACTQALMLLFHLAVGSKVEKSGEDDGDSQIDLETDKVDGLEKGKPKAGRDQEQQQDRFYRALYATLSKGNNISGGKHQTMYYNLLYKAMKYDTDMTRIHVFAKRLLASVMHAPPASIAASLFLLQEISKSHQGLRDSWENVPDPESDAWIVLDDNKREPKAGLVNRSEDAKGINEHPATAEGTPPGWEIALLNQNFHPSVAKFANDIGEIEYAGDPLQDFGLAPFLDKFAYRNPKSVDKASRLQLGRATTTPYHRRMGKLQARLQLPVNDPSFLERTNVNEQEEFFHRFFAERARRDQLKGITRRADVAAVKKDEVENAKGKKDKDDEDDGWDAEEQRALDDAEVAEGFDGGGGKPFEEYEAQWETDEEEEAFVDSLAVQLLEDAAGGPADIDDDPEGLEDWGDLHDDFDDTGVKGSSDEASDDENDSVDGTSDEVGMVTKTGSISQIRQNVVDEDDGDDDEDAFMESGGLDEDSEDDDSDEEPDLDEPVVADGMAFDGLVHAEQDQEDLAEGKVRDGASEDDDASDDDDNAFGLSLVDDESDVDAGAVDDNGTEKGDVRGKNSMNKKGDLPTFASADDYEEMIEKSFQKLKRAAPTSTVDDEEEGVADISIPRDREQSEKRQTSHKRRRKNRKK